MQGVPAQFDQPETDRAIFSRPAGRRSGVELYRARILHHRFAPHRHDGYGLGVIESGAERFDYGGREHHASAGSLVMMHPDTLHTGGAAAPEGWTYRMVYVEAQVLDEAMAGDVRAGAVWHFGQAVHHEPARAARIAALTGRLWQAATAAEADDALMDWLGLWRPLASLPGPAPALAGAARLAQVRERLCADPMHAPTLAELAGLAGMSPFHLQRSFKAVHHATPQQWRMAHWMAEAKARLARGQAPADVAAAVGMADQAHLTRRFAGMYGCTPARYQRDLGLRPPGSGR